jgi:CRP-like cAMP-binding protein
VLPHFRQIEFKKNDFLIKAGESSNNYWFLEQGFIRSYTFNTEGDDITTNFYSAGDIVIDWISFFLRHPSREYIQAAEDCVCWARGDAFKFVLVSKDILCSKRLLVF